MEQRGVIIVAGGSGTRMGGGTLPKQFRLLDGKPVLAHTIDLFAEALPGAPIVVVVPAAHLDFWKDYAARFDIARHTVVAGGEERFHSVRNGLEALPRSVEIVAIHDGVRPLCSKALILSTVACAEEYGAAIPVVAPVDSLRRLTDTGSEPVDRSQLRCVQTPQVFRAETLRQAYAWEFDPSLTDDAQAVERLGVKIRLCEGERDNLKITTAVDLLLAEAVIESRRQEAETAAEIQR